MLKPLVSACLLASVLAKDLAISLDTTWKPYPLALAVLEGVGNQNSSAYFPLLNELSSLLEEKPQITDEQTYSWFLETNSERQFCSSECLALLNAELASNHFAASIEAQYNLFESIVADKDLQACENVLMFGSTSYCNPTDVFALKVPSANADQALIDGDHTYSECENCPNAVLYADILSPDFLVFHRNLVLSAENDKLKYTIRYKPSRTLTGVASPKLAGFGATLQLKRTDYLVLDDRSSSTNKFDSSNLKLNTTETLSSDDKLKFPVKAIGYVLSQEDQFEALYNVSANLPSYVHEINELRQSAKIKKATSYDRKLHNYPGGGNYVFLNGAVTITDSAASLHKLLEDISKEMVNIEDLNGFGLNNTEIRVLMEETTPGIASSQKERPRYEVDETSIVWINDLERDRSYKQWASEPSALLENQRPEALAQVRSNLYNLVLAINIDDVQSLQLLGAVIQTANRGAPIRIGILPLSLNNDNQLLTKAFAFGGTPAAYAFLSLMLQGLKPREAFDKLELSEYKSEAEIKFHELLETKLGRQMDALKLGEPCVLANGIIRELNSDVIGAALMQFLDEEIMIREKFSEDPEPSFDEFKNLILKGSIRKRNKFLDPVSITSQVKVDTAKLYSGLGVNFRQLKKGSKNKPTIWAGIDILSKEGQQQMLAKANGFVARFFPVLDNLDATQKVRALEVFASLLVSNSKIDAGLISSYSDYIRGNSALDTAIEIGQEQLLEFELFCKDLKQTAGQYIYILDGTVYNPTAPFSAQELTALAKKSYLRNSKAGALIESKGFSQSESEVLLSKLGVWDGKSFRKDLSALYGAKNTITVEADAPLSVTALIDPSNEKSQDVVSLLRFLKNAGLAKIQVIFNPAIIGGDFKPNRYFADSYDAKPRFDAAGRLAIGDVVFHGIQDNVIHVVGLAEPPAWITVQKKSAYDLDNLVTSGDSDEQTINVSYELKALLIEGFTFDRAQQARNKGVQLQLQPMWTDKGVKDTSVMENLGYFQLQAQPGPHKVKLQNEFAESHQFESNNKLSNEVSVMVNGLLGEKFGASIVSKESKSVISNFFGKVSSQFKGLAKSSESQQADINIFTVASGHLYERFLSIMMLSVMKSTTHTVKFWLIEKYLSPSFKEFLPVLAEKLNCDYELVDYKWPMWLTGQSEKQREIWGYKILFLDVLFPQALKNVLFVDSDQIVRTDLIDLTEMDLKGAPYAYTPMGDDRPETEGFRFWKKGYWQKRLDGKPYHISALYKVDLERFKELSAGNILRQHYQQLSQNAGSLSNLDQDLPNDLQSVLPIYSLDDSWLWCETWCSDERLKTAKTIDLCNNPLTKEPKLDRARRQMPEWQVYDDQIAAWRLELDQDQIQEDTPVPETMEELLVDELEGIENHDEL